MWGIIATWRMALEGVTESASALAAGKPVSAAVVDAVAAVEDFPFYKSVGYGGLPTENGEVELDAAYMDGDTLAFGAVGNLVDIANPVRVAHALSRQRYNSLLVGQGAHHLQHLTHQLGVEGAGRLVEIDDLGVGGEGAGDGHTLLLTARELAGVVVGPVGEADLFQHLHADGISLRFGHLPGDDEALGDVLQGRFVAEEVVVLEDESRLAAQPRDAGAVGVGEVEGLTVEGELACVRRLKKVETTQQGGLARAGRAEDGHDVALFHRQIDAAQHVQTAGRLGGAAKDAGMDAGLCVSMEGFVDAAYL